MPTATCSCADYLNNRIRKVDTAGLMTTVATSYPPMALNTDVAGNVYFYEKDTLTLRKWSPNGTVTEVAGNHGLSDDESEGQDAINTYIPDGWVSRCTWARCTSPRTAWSASSRATATSIPSAASSTTRGACRSAGIRWW
jgi:hypothetical protein